jgi:MFS family permease
MSQNPAHREPSINAKIGSIIVFTAISASAIGIPLAVLPIYIHDSLGYGAVVTGLALSTQAISMIASRPLAGRISDRVSAKQAIVFGLLACAVSGLLTLLAPLFVATPPLSVALIALGRLAQGLAQGLIGTGSLSWGISVAGTHNASKVISLNGVANYGMLAFGPPLGLAIAHVAGLWSLGATVMLLCAFGLAWASRLATPGIVAGTPMSFGHVFKVIAPYGIVLGLSTVGLSAISTFITLYFTAEGWDYAAWCLSAFGIGFVGSRLLFSRSIARIGGLRTATLCIATETLGLLMIWLAPNAAIAIVGAGVTGLGISLIYPALGVECVNRVTPSNRSSALGAFSLCNDVSVGLAGPVAGLVASGFGFAAIFAFSSLMSLAAWLLNWRLDET